MLPLVDISYIADEIRQHAADLSEAYEDQDGDADTDTDPGILLAALSDLFDGLRLLEEDVPVSEQNGAVSLELRDIHALGGYGIDLLARLAAVAGRLLLPQHAREIEELALPLACWIARHGGELRYLGPVVNGAASLANRLKQPSELAQLYGLLTEVVNAVDPQIPQDTTSTDPTRPWRVLLINRAIVATRSHALLLMNEAFESIVEHLPEEAPTFFREGMEQMDALRYPPEVRALMQDYYERWCGRRVLH